MLIRAIHLSSPNSAKPIGSSLIVRSGKLTGLGPIQLVAGSLGYLHHRRSGLFCQFYKPSRTSLPSVLSMLRPCFKRGACCLLNLHEHGTEDIRALFKAAGESATDESEP